MAAEGSMPCFCARLWISFVMSFAICTAIRYCVGMNVIEILGWVMLVIFSIPILLLPLSLFVDV